MCMHMSAYVCGVSICVCLYVCGGADLAWMMGFGIMVVSGCSSYVTEPVDVVLVVTGRVLYVVGGWAAACMYGVVVVVVLGGIIIYDSVDGGG